ncbi:MAG: DUF6370 family protein [Planctomycetota bacterium]|jgi:hypothetical protein
MLRTCVLIIVSGLLLAFIGCKEKAQTTAPAEKEAVTAAKVQTVALQTAEAGCGGCIFKMEGVTGCKLAVKIAGKPYLVTGADVDAHKSGLCSSSKQAQVAGKIQGGKLVASQFTLKP